MATTTRPTTTDDDDLAYRKGPDGGVVFTHKDGTPY